MHKPENTSLRHRGLRHRGQCRLDRQPCLTHDHINGSQTEKMFNNRSGRERRVSDAELSLATRAAWLSYVGGLTQEEIASRLSVSRVKVARLVAAAQRGRSDPHLRR